MNNSKNLSLHYLVLAGVIILGAGFRFWHLDLKPLWLDEVLTALLSLGGRYEDVPLNVVFPPSTLEHLFRLQPNVSWFEIAKSVATQSTHPPLFFGLMHQWLNWVEPLPQSWIWKLRSLPALLGVGAIASIYCLNRIAFSPAAGLMAAALMAVSPFAVYLSQEARHYTLPMLCITLALLGLLKIQQSLYSQRKLPPPWVWLWWSVVNSIGCYIHYFFILAFIAQILTLTSLMYWRRRILPRGSWMAVGLAVVGVAVSYLPWLPVMLASLGRAETRWLPRPENIVPLYQTLVGWVIMVITLPVEGQPWWIQVPVVLLTIGFSGWVGWYSWRGFKHIWCDPSTHLATFTLSCFTLGVLLQFFAIIYLLGKDISVVPRYNFVYYPAVCALLGSSLLIPGLPVRKLDLLPKSISLDKPPVLSAFYRRLSAFICGSQSKILIFVLSLLSCVFVVFNLVFLKPFHPQQVAREMTFEQAVPMLMVVGYDNFQDVALGLSFALAINQLHSDSEIGSRPDTGNTRVSFGFFDKKSGYEFVWKKLSRLPEMSVPRLNLWVVAPGLRDEDYPPQIAIANQTYCTNDPTQHHRIGIPYQLYRCKGLASFATTETNSSGSKGLDK